MGHTALSFDRSLNAGFGGVDRAYYAMVNVTTFVYVRAGVDVGA